MCVCYKDNKPCHTKIKELNCFVCYCPNYDTKFLEGGCKINSKNGKWAYYSTPKKGRVWDCTDCTNNHFPSYVEEFIKKNLSDLQEEYAPISSNFCVVTNRKIYKY